GEVAAVGVRRGLFLVATHAGLDALEEVAVNQRLVGVLDYHPFFRRGDGGLWVAPGRLPQAAPSRAGAPSPRVYPPGPIPQVTPVDQNPVDDGAGPARLALGAGLAAAVQLLGDVAERMPVVIEGKNQLHHFRLKPVRDEFAPPDRVRLAAVAVEASAARVLALPRPQELAGQHPARERLLLQPLGLLRNGGADPAGTAVPVGEPLRGGF